MRTKVSFVLVLLALSASARAPEPPPPPDAPAPPPVVEPPPPPPVAPAPPVIYSPGYGDLPGLFNTRAPRVTHPRETRTPIRYEKKPRWKMIIAGIAMFGIAYIADIGLTYGLYHDPGWESLIPVAGPLMQFGDNTYDTAFGHLVAGSLELTGFAFQAIGVILVAVGATAWQKTPVYAEDGRNTALLDSLTNGRVRPAPGGVAITF